MITCTPVAPEHTAQTRCHPPQAQKGKRGKEVSGPTVWAVQVPLLHHEHSSLAFWHCKLEVHCSRRAITAATLNPSKHPVCRARKAEFDKGVAARTYMHNLQVGCCSSKCTKASLQVLWRTWQSGSPVGLGTHTLGAMHCEREHMAHDQSLALIPSAKLQVPYALPCSSGGVAQHAGKTAGQTMFLARPFDQAGAITVTVGAAAVGGHARYIGNALQPGGHSSSKNWEALS